jgi:hypothetical protein
MYAYLIGIIGLAMVFSFLCFARRDLKKVMLYSGLLYLSYGFVMFLAIKLFSSEPAKTITPGYWSPPSLFGLNGKTGGYGIEDALFSFFFGAIAAGLFEVVFKLKISKKTNKKLRKRHALLFALLAGGVFIAFAPVNAIYFFIFVQFLGAVLIAYQRRDLILHSLIGGVLLMALYATLFIIFNSLFPHFIGQYYHLERTSHTLILGIPLEEYLYALSLGMMWAPIYDYMHRVKDQSNKRRLSKPRKIFPAAGGARR